MSRKYIKELFYEWNEKALNGVVDTEEEYFSLNEVLIKSNEHYSYEETTYGSSWIAYSFYDRCKNNIYAIFNPQTGEFKSGFKLENIPNLIFDFKDASKYDGLIHPCSDDKRVPTLYDILSKEIVPKYIMVKGAHKLYLNPISTSRQKLSNMILNNLEQDFPELIRRNNYLTYVNY